jgi:RP/EB family microtubule-associated protein
MAAGDTIGMMEGAFFVSRSELLSWINDLLSINMTKVEQMASGAAYCQMMDAIFPGTINLGKVNFMAKLPHEFVNNYKVLQ